MRMPVPHTPTSGSAHIERNLTYTAAGQKLEHRLTEMTGLLVAVDEAP